MANDLILRERHNRPISDQLHPAVFGLMAGLTVWFAAAAWILFDRQADVSLPLAVVSGLLLVALLIPWTLARVWRRQSVPTNLADSQPSFRDWAFGDCATWQGKQRGTHAAIEALLPIAAVAFGLTALGIAFVVIGASAP